MNDFQDRKSDLRISRDLFLVKKKNLLQQGFGVSNICQQFRDSDKENPVESREGDFRMGS